MDPLDARTCSPCHGTVAALSLEAAAAFTAQLDGWTLDTSQPEAAIERRFGFTDFDEALAFVNALAWVARKEDHHPDVTLGWGRVTVRFWTHAAGGLTENDFICAAKIDRLVRDGS
jgi:4a-hydroxytetrahydrobiopterin dehydratase